MGPTLFLKIFENQLMYFITAAVLAAGILFKFLRAPMKRAVERIVCRIPLRIFVFGLILILGIASSVITAIVSALVPGGGGEYDPH